MKKINAHNNVNLVEDKNFRQNLFTERSRSDHFLKKYITYIVFFVSAIAMAQSPVTMEVDTLAIRIGEQIEYKLSVDKTKQVLFPILVLDSLKKVEVVEDLPVDTADSKFIKKYLLTSFDSGSYVIPRQQVLINNKAYSVDSLLIHVSTVEVDTLKQNLYGLKSLKNQPIIFDDYKNYVWIALGILALIIAIILYFVLRKKKEEIPIEDRIPPYQLAMQRLGALDEKQLWQNDKVKLYYIELTDIIRTYIERELEIPALESTTDELIETILDFNKIQTLNLPKKTIKELQKLLRQADLVKFAKHKPGAGEIEGHRTWTEGIINELRPEEVEVIEDLNAILEASVTEKEFQKKKKKRKRTIIIVVGSIALMVMITVSTLIFKSIEYAQENIVGYQSEELLEGEWFNGSYGSPSISIETPKILKSQPVEVPPQARNMIDQISQFTYRSIVGGLEINIVTVDFSSNVNQYDVESGANALIQNMESIGAKFSLIDKEEINVENLEGVRISADYEMVNPVTNNPEIKKLKAVLLGDVNGTMTVFVNFNSEDEDGEKIAERIINSIQLN